MSILYTGIITTFIVLRCNGITEYIVYSVIPLQGSYSKSSDDSSIQYTRLSHYNVATVKVVMIPAYNILSYPITR
jgi:hypothetical protein